MKGFININFIFGTKRTFFLSFLICASIVLAAIAAPATLSAKQKKVLILHSYHEGLFWTDNIMQGMMPVLNASQIPVEIHVEYMDTKRHPPGESFSFLGQLYAQKYKNIHFDLILLSDNNALNFIVANRDQLFQDVPVVFCGINNFSQDLLAGRRGITGITEGIDIKGTMDLALKLNPEINHFVAINDLTPTGKANRLKWENLIFKRPHPNTTYEMWDTIGVEKLKNKLSSLPEKTGLLVFSFHRDDTGQWLSIPEFMKIISDHSTVPIYSFWNHYNNLGSIGGVLVNGEEQGRRCAEYGLKILNGTPASTIPVLIKSPNLPVLDFNLLKKFRLPKANAPQETLFLNEPESFIKKYRHLVLSFSILFLILITLLIILSFNILKRRKVEKALRHHRERLSLVIKGSNDAPWDWNLANNHIYYSPQWWQQIGYEPNELKADPWLWRGLLHPDDVATIDEKYEKAFQSTSDSFEIECRLKHKKGHYVPILCRGTITRDPNGTPIRMTGTNMDLTERKLAEDSLRISQERFLTVLNSIDASIYVSELDSHKILFMNRHMINEFGSDLTGEICWKALRGEESQCPVCKKDELLNEDGQPIGLITWQDINPLTKKWYINHDRAIEWTDGRLVKLQISTDITEIKKLEEEVRQAHKMESIGILAGGIAHDFNNILGIIIGNIEMAIEVMPDDSPVRKYIYKINDASFRARDVVMQLLSFSRKTEKDLRFIDIASVIKETLKLVRSSMPASIDIQDLVPDNCDPVLADATQIHQIILNLCSNAADSLVDQSGIIQISATPFTVNDEQTTPLKDLMPGNYLRLVVKDNGVGISAKNCEKIFDPYFTTKEIGKGTGMGLAVVHGIVKNHGGHIYVESQIDHGTSICMLFPVKPGQEVINTDGIFDESVPEGTETILFVDDEKDIVEMSVDLLESLGYTIIGRTNPVKALEDFVQNPAQFDLVISDMTMPELSGMDLTKEINAIRPNLPIIICSGHSTVIEEQEIMENDVTEFIRKPIAMAQIAQAIRKVLDS